MMQNIFVRAKGMALLAIYTFLSVSLGAQKPLIDIYGESWGGLGPNSISNNGEYIAYNVNNGSEDDLLIRFTVSARQLCVPRSYLVAITQDSRKIIFSRGDSIVVMDLDVPNGLLYLKNIKTWQVVKWGSVKDLLIYSVKERPDELIIRDLDRGVEKAYPAVRNYWVKIGRES